MIGIDPNQDVPAWGGHDMDAPARLVSATPPRSPEVNGAPVVEQSHEYVLRAASEEKR